MSLHSPARADDFDLVRRLHAHVDLIAGIIGPRYVGKPDMLQATAAYIENRFTEMGDQTERLTYRALDVDVHNLVVERPGTRPDLPALVVGAHYDTVPGTPGADDNTSAVAVLLETARLLVGTRLRRTVRFVSFPCEEPPHFYTREMGSEVYARMCRERGEQLAGMLCLEMVGYFSDEPRSQGCPPGIPRLFRPLFPSRGNFIAAVGNLRSVGLLFRFRRGFKRRTRLPLFSIALPERIHEIRLSDNSSFWDHGYPALMITDTSFLRNPHYHLPSDTPETLDYDRLADVVRGVAGAVCHICRKVRA